MTSRAGGGSIFIKRNAQGSTAAFGVMMAAGVVYQAESGHSLGSWSSAGVTEELDPDAAPIGGSTPYRSRVPITPGVSKFLRIKAIR